MQIEKLDKIGFVPFDYPMPLRDAVMGALESWQKFCTLPLDKKRILSGGDRINDFGYMKRQDSGPNRDDKELFHALRANYSMLLPLAERIGDRRAINFIHAVETLLVRMGPIVRMFARGVEEHYGLHGFESEVMRSQDYWIFRYLKYPKGQPLLANAHADRGGFTFHLCETEGGGEYYGFGREWLPWPVSERATIIFPSMGMQFRSRNHTKALWHRVVPVESPASERYAMVAFVDFQFSHKFDDSRFNMKDFEPGFNYSLPFSEFAKYFVPRKELVPG